MHFTHECRPPHLIYRKPAYKFFSHLQGLRCLGWDSIANHGHGRRCFTCYIFTRHVTTVVLPAWSGGRRQSKRVAEKHKTTNTRSAIDYQWPALNSLDTGNVRLEPMDWFDFLHWTPDGTWRQSSQHCKQDGRKKLACSTKIWTRDIWFSVLLTTAALVHKGVHRSNPQRLPTYPTGRPADSVAFMTSVISPAPADLYPRVSRPMTHFSSAFGNRDREVQVVQRKLSYLMASHPTHTSLTVPKVSMSAFVLSK